MSTLTSNERLRFEVWAQKEGFAVPGYDLNNGRYFDEAFHWMWFAWKSRAERHAPETLQPHQNLALARINHLARKGRFDEADAQLFRDAIVHRPGSVPHHHIWSVNGPPRDPDPEQVCDFGCGLKWKDRQEAEAHAQKALEPHPLMTPLPADEAATLREVIGPSESEPV